MDREHKKIVVLINSMFEALRDQKDQDAVRLLLSEVVTYTEYHFQNEEKEMERLDYPDLKDNKKEHQQLLAKTVEFENRLDEDFLSGSKQFYRFLREWLTDHILRCDMKYGKIIASRQKGGPLPFRPTVKRLIFPTSCDEALLVFHLKQRAFIHIRASDCSFLKCRGKHPIGLLKRYPDDDETRLATTQSTETLFHSISALNVTYLLTFAIAPFIDIA